MDPVEEFHECAKYQLKCVSMLIFAWSKPVECICCKI